MATRSRRKTKGLPSRLIKVLLKLVVYFLLITLAWVGLMAFLPVPITATMIMDDNNITKDWEPLESISPNLTRAVIAAEDSKFCSHDGGHTLGNQAQCPRRSYPWRLHEYHSRSRKTSFSGKAVVIFAKDWKPILRS